MRGVLVGVFLLAMVPVSPAVEARPPPTSSVPEGPAVLFSRIIKLHVVEGGVVVTLAVGSAQGVTPAWKAHILEGATARPLPDGELEIIRVDARMTVARTSLSAEAIRQHARVQLAR